ncbi:hypothetical protein [Methanocella arvoryzae]|uniref:hypothetical protein n=1 Tax=Methanocella arvoryzae TaxID=1175445 RepID=UPI00064F7D6F|nr:hypothetical protein [Methanocella arvoryzae]
MTIAALCLDTDLTDYTDCADGRRIMPVKTVITCFIYWAYMQSVIIAWRAWHLGELGGFTSEKLETASFSSLCLIKAPIITSLLAVFQPSQGKH